MPIFRVNMMCNGDQTVYIVQADNEQSALEKCTAFGLWVDLGMIEEINADTPVEVCECYCDEE